MNAFGLHWDTLFGLASWQWTLIITPVAVALMARLGRLRANSRNGWSYLSPSVAGYAMLLLSVLMTLFFAVSAIVAIGAFVQGDRDRVLLFLMVLAPPLTALGAYGVFNLGFVRFRFNGEGVERRVLGRRIFMAWAEISAIERHWFFGPRILTREGNAYAVWESLRGFQDFIAATKANQIPVSI